jgi:endonuclease/exonuclease/phosphatase family metal-dependent hydrolase
VGLAPQFSAVLQQHVGRIEAALRENEPVVWGGDFNQDMAGSAKGQRELLDAFKRLDLEPLTMNSRHLVPERGSIDHLAVSLGCLKWSEPAVQGQPGGSFSSDHAFHLVDGA